MSSKRKNVTHYRLTPSARQHLLEIGRYSRRHWGRVQTTLYLKGLEHHFQLLSENPYLGKQRDDIAEGYFSFPYRRHVIFYLISKQDIDIIAIAHQHMDTLLYLSTN